MLAVTTLINKKLITNAFKQADAKIQGQLKHAINKGAVNVATSAKTKTPVDTGRLRASIGIQSVDDGFAAEVGTNVEYAPYIEFGTQNEDESERMAARPFLGPALQEEIPKIQSDIKDALRGVLK